MKFDDFLKSINENKKVHKQQFNYIKDEFISQGYEKFLFLTYREEMAYLDLSRSVLNKFEITPLAYNTIQSIADFITDESDSYGLFFRYAPTKSYYIANEVALRAYNATIVPNLFNDDTSINQAVYFKEDQIFDLALMYFILFSSPTAPKIAGYALYNVNLEYITAMCSFNGNPIRYDYPDSLVHFMGNITRRDNDPIKIKQTREIIHEIMNKSIFESELEISFAFRELIMRKMQSMFEKVQNRIQIALAQKEIDKVEIKTAIEEIFNKLVIEKKIPVKWKHEREMFDLIFSMFNDALFQYKPYWLSPQNFDVFVPSLNTAFEYQGIQHYESIPFFGGDQALVKRRALDERKKVLSKENGVKLLEWHYEESITKTVLMKKIARH